MRRRRESGMSGEQRAAWLAELEGAVRSAQLAIEQLRRDGLGSVELTKLDCRLETVRVEVDFLRHHSLRISDAGA